MAKRIKVTKNNKFLHKKGNVSHLLTNKGSSLGSDKYGKVLCDAESQKMKNLIPYKLR